MTEERVWVYLDSGFFSLIFFPTLWFLYMCKCKSHHLVPRGFLLFTLEIHELSVWGQKTCKTEGHYIVVTRTYSFVYSNSDICSSFPQSTVDPWITWVWIAQVLYRFFSINTTQGWKCIFSSLWFFLITFISSRLLYCRKTVYITCNIWNPC